ncbi:MULTISPECIES: NUDIX hydrolase [unclassified Breznakia]|uniref:NUDIX domain-containing protein n=1 Tax=unclassified Breznakia TaxID=2623764 RepID=UPI002476994A|nr:MULTISPECIES: NUDIX hydrolase [unclassified Breznakia]MDH6366758.1 8-oxo-dGTP diphosphatase [Breznakia sp. PH1-1]MDH6403855.1 8-oxo-dGTP diphosphatase [Breznakia sp. PF1-11]MDH6411564.1 8-oxo-dGTP diphosphatase [Breznakia sp. PFB1-11]MDH6413928.1 8-oxo-dGTP diphosphatase [Breznakia sp. PFB1-14]MDH6416357.1 8-oxo-dGTP diphosphatase [Breznakia sp. PFB1-4]
MRKQIAVKALIQKQNDFLVLHKTVEEAKYDASDSLYDLPGGRVEVNETMYDALIREVFEETGIQIQQKQIEKEVNKVDVQRKDGTSLHVITYLVHVNTEKITLSNEHEAYMWLNKSSDLYSILPEYIQLLMENVISDDSNHV